MSIHSIWFLSAIAAFTLISFFIFGFWYFKIYESGFSKVTEYKGKKISGAEMPEPTFFISNDYNFRAVVNASNSMRTGWMINKINPIVWMHFGLSTEDKTGSAELDKAMDELRDMGLRGLMPEALVDKVFRDFPAVEYEFWEGPTGYKSQERVRNQFINFQKRVVAENILSSADAAALEQEVMSYLYNSKQGYLVNLGSFLNGTAEKYSHMTNNAAKLKNYLYRTALDGFSQGILLSYDKVKDRLGYFDFLYFAIIGNGDIQPVSLYARTVHMAQILIIGILTAIFMSLFIAILIEK